MVQQNIEWTEMPEPIPANRELRDAAILALSRAGWSDRDIVAALKSARSLQNTSESFVRHTRVSKAKRDEWSEVRRKSANLPWQDMPSAYLLPSMRLSKILKAEGITTIGQFIEWGSSEISELLSIPKLGKTSLKEIGELRAKIEADPEGYVAIWRTF